MNFSERVLKRKRLLIAIGSFWGPTDQWRTTTPLGRLRNRLLVLLGLKARLLKGNACNCGQTFVGFEVEWPTAMAAVAQGLPLEKSQ